MVFSDWVELPDGTRRKVFKIGLAEIPDTPQKALQNYIMHTPEGIVEMRKQVESEEQRLTQARLLLNAFEQVTVSLTDLKLP